MQCGQVPERGGRAVGPYAVCDGSGIVSVVDTTSASLTSVPTILTPEAVAVLPLEPLGPISGAMHRVLWRDGDSMAGVLTIEAGHRLGTHTHRTNHHHIWVLHGAARILGTELHAGSYVHVPSGVEHDIDASDTGGCTVFYLYARPGR